MSQYFGLITSHQSVNRKNGNDHEEFLNQLSLDSSSLTVEYNDEDGLTLEENEHEFLEASKTFENLQKILIEDDDILEDLSEKEEDLLKHVPKRIFSPVDSSKDTFTPPSISSSLQSCEEDFVVGRFAKLAIDIFEESTKVPIKNFPEKFIFNNNNEAVYTYNLIKDQETLAASSLINIPNQFFLLDKFEPKELLNVDIINDEMIKKEINLVEETISLIKSNTFPSTSNMLDSVYFDFITEDLIDDKLVTNSEFDNSKEPLFHNSSMTDSVYLDAEEDIIELEGEKNANILIDNIARSIYMDLNVSEEEYLYSFFAAKKNSLNVDKIINIINFFNISKSILNDLKNEILLFPTTSLLVFEDLTTLPLTNFVARMKLKPNIKNIDGLILAKNTTIQLPRIESKTIKKILPEISTNFEIEKVRKEKSLNIFLYLSNYLKNSYFKPLFSNFYEIQMTIPKKICYTEINNTFLWYLKSE